MEFKKWFFSIEIIDCILYFKILPFLSIHYGKRKSIQALIEKKDVLVGVAYSKFVQE
jgi:hypothetical protein